MSRSIAPVLLLALVSLTGPALAQETAAKPDADAAAAAAEEKAVRQVSESLVQAFNAGKADEVGKAFYEGAELIDDEGTVHRGRETIEKLCAKFFEKFPGSVSTMKTESVWFVGPALAIEEGQRSVTTKDGGATSATRYTLVLMKQANTWKIASVRETEDDAGLTPHDRLKSLEWMVGQWVDEGSDAVIQISCRWSEDKNFLLADYDVKVQGRPQIKSTQRIGWDPLSKKIKSWVFDSDGGHGEAIWTQVDDHWVVKSSAVLPDGQTGSATLILEPGKKDRYVMKGVDRIRGEASEPDFEVTIVRRPPAPVN